MVDHSFVRVLDSTPLHLACCEELRSICVADGVTQKLRYSPNGLLQSSYDPWRNPCGQL